jgi:microcin C transport system permease protein
MHELTKKRINKFKSNKRAYWSLKIFLVMFVISLFAEIVANDKPFFVWYKGEAYIPAIATYADKEFGGDFETEADYKDPLIKNNIAENGFMLMPLIEYSYTFSLGTDVLVAPSLEHPLGTDDSGRDIAARLLYGFRLSVLFGLALTIASSAIGIIVGSLQGYFGGLLDIIMQRFMEIWDSMPLLLVLIILSSIFEPTIISMFFIMLAFKWMRLVDPVRAEFLRARNFDYVRAARAIGVSEYRIIFRHILPNALVSSLSFLPFILTTAITILSILDYLGFGLQSSYPSLGELTAQGKNNMDKPWIGISAFIFMSLTLSLLVFVSEGVRDAFDPRKQNRKAHGA